MVITGRVLRHVVVVMGYRETLQPEVSVELLDHSVVVLSGQADLLGPREPLFDLIRCEPDTFGQAGQFPGVGDSETGVDVRGLLQVPPHQVVGVGAVVDMLVELVGADDPGVSPAATCARYTCSMYLYRCSILDSTADGTVVSAAYPMVMPVPMVRVPR
jgi:hypothetical protein